MPLDLDGAELAALIALLKEAIAADRLSQRDALSDWS